MSAESRTPKRIAIVTGGTRGIGRGITESLAETREYDGFLLTYNTNKEAAEAFVNQLQKQHDSLSVELVGGDISLPQTRDEIFDCFDSKFADCSLATVVHNAGQYVGITSDNAEGLTRQSLAFGDGSLLQEDGKPNFEEMRYYQRMYGEAYVDLCERGLARMRKAAEEQSSDKTPFCGSLIGISAPGCNAMQRPSVGYDMPGSGKSLMEYAMRLFAVRAAPHRVNCNVIIPGVTQTEAWDRLEESRGMAKGGMVSGSVDRSVPMGVAIKPKEIGDAVAFLSSFGGGRFITGVSLPVDGGLHLGPTRKPPS